MYITVHTSFSPIQSITPSVAIFLLSTRERHRNERSNVTDVMHLVSAMQGYFAISRRRKCSLAMNDIHIVDKIHATSYIHVHYYCTCCVQYNLCIHDLPKSAPKRQPSEITNRKIHLHVVSKKTITKRERSGIMAKHTHTRIQVIKDPLHVHCSSLIDISTVHFTRQKCKTNGIQTSHVLTSLTSPIGTRGGAVSLI
jgi:hypothetical protein